MEKPRRGVTVSALAILVCWLLALSGCEGKGTETQAESKALAPYPSSLSTQSSPSQVAEVLIQALDAGDDQVLQGLVAVQREAEAIDRIYGKYGKKHATTPADAAALAASGWKASYAWFAPGTTYVVRENINGDTAWVKAQGVNPTTRKARELVISMVQEEGVWKVAAGLKATQL